LSRAHILRSGALLRGWSTPESVEALVELCHYMKIVKVATGDVVVR
jgi:hypothetical protein